MKQPLILTSAFFIFTLANGQITKRNWLVGGDANYSSTNYKSTATSNTTQNNIQISPAIAYFIADKFPIGLKVSIDRTSNKTTGSTGLSRYTTYDFGPFMRYYFLHADQQFNILIEGSYHFGIERGGGSSTGNNLPITQYTENTFSIATGPVLYFNTSVGIEFLLGYSTTKYIGLAGQNNRIQIGLGLQVSLEKE